jgi:eukaryotic-like serine/threonine-protein kinase
MSDASKDNSTKRERFGRYLILDHLVDGGMAKICRARFLGEQADKIVAIKMVRPQYSMDESFKTMFMDEIKLTFGLIHPNVIQTYDYGFHNDQLFVAMEYCDGRNLKEYLDKLRERKFVFPVEISTYIITQVCQGLHYAHTLTDKLTGKEVSIIHRDISPHNIMLTYDGAVKVIDFGIAKSDTNSEATQAGTIKGKLSYLAPEYLEGHELDPRYDEFAVGITLWEMLCSRKLFKANNDLAVLKKIQECKIPAPSSINPNVPKDLDEIVLKALSKDRNKRYADLDQLNRALMKFLYTHYPDFNSTDLSYFAKELFKDDIKKDREKLFEFGKIDLRPYLDAVKKEQAGGISGGAGGSESSSTVEDTEIKAREREQVIDFGFEEEDSGAAGEGKIRVSQLRNNKGAAAAKSADSIPPKIAKKKPSLESAAEAPEVSLSIEKSAPKLGHSQSDGLATKTKTSLSQSGRSNKTDSKTRIRSKSSGTKQSTAFKKIKSKSSSSDGSKRLFTLVASIAVVAGVLYTQFETAFNEILGFDKPTVAMDNASTPGQKLDEPDRNPAGEDETSGKKGRIRFDGAFNRFGDKVYVNGQEVKYNEIREIQVPVNQELVIRIEPSRASHPRARPFITKLTHSEEGRTRVVEVPPYVEGGFGTLQVGHECIKGVIEFELYGEKRVERVRRGLNINFPVPTRDGRQVHRIDFRRENESNTLTFNIDFKDNVTEDLCDRFSN